MVGRQFGQHLRQQGGVALHQRAAHDTAGQGVAPLKQPPPQCQVGAGVGQGQVHLAGGEAPCGAGGQPGQALEAGQRQVQARRERVAEVVVAAQGLGPPEQAGVAFQQVRVGGGAGAHPLQAVRRLRRAPGRIALARVLQQRPLVKGAAPARHPGGIRTGRGVAAQVLGQQRHLARFGHVVAAGVEGGETVASLRRRHGGLQQGQRPALLRRRPQRPRQCVQPGGGQHQQRQPAGQPLEATPHSDLPWPSRGPAS